MSAFLPFKKLSGDLQGQILNDLKVKKEYNPFAAKKSRVYDPGSLIVQRTTTNGYYVPLGYAFKKCPRKVARNSLPVEVDLEITDPDTLYDYQEYFLEEALSRLHRDRATFLALATASGKTKLGTHLTCHVGLVTCVVFYGDLIGRQWYDDFSRNTNADILFVGKKKINGVKIPQPEEPDVIVCSVGQIKKLTAEQKSEIGFVIVDEAHQWTTQNRIEALLTLEPYYLLGLSATPKKNKKLSEVTEIFFNEIELVRKMDKPHRIFKVITGIEYTIPEDSTNIWFDLKNYLFTNERRNELIARLAKFLQNRKLLIMTWDVQVSVLPLEGYLQKEGIEYDTLTGSKKTYQNAQTLLGTFGKLGTGFDQKEGICEGYDGKRFDTLLMIGSIKNLGSYEQYVGRVARAKKFDVMYLVDDNPIPEKHFKACYGWEKKHNGHLVELDLTGCRKIQEIEKIYNASVEEFKKKTHPDILKGLLD